MSTIFYVLDGGLELHVGNPGYGQILLYAPDSIYDGKPIVRDVWHRNLHGPEIGEFLDKLTDRALAPEPPRRVTLPARPAAPPKEPAWGVHLPAFMTPDRAKLVLPVFIRAMALAVGGTERFDRTFVDPEDGPREPFCVRCNQGTLFSPGPMANSWCEQFGHTPYGHADGTTWEAAQAHYERKRRWREEDLERARQAEALKSGLEQDAVDLDRERRERRPDPEGN